MNIEARSGFNPHEFYKKAQAHFDESGGDRHWTRRNYFLPYNWRHLSPGDIAEIVEALCRPLAADASIEEKETRLAVAAVMTTGRRLAELVSLRVYPSLASLDQSDDKIGLYLTASSAFWKLPPGKAIWKDKAKATKAATGTHLKAGPGKKVSKKPRRKARKAKKKPTRRWVVTETSELLREQIAVLGLREATEAAPIFTLKLSRLNQLVGKFLRSRRGADDDEPRWAARTVESLERYLLQALTNEAGGDFVRGGATHQSN